MDSLPFPAKTIEAGEWKKTPGWSIRKARPHIFLVTPQKLREFSMKNLLNGVNFQKGLVKITGTSFCSETSEGLQWT